MASRNPAFDRLLSYSQKNDNISITSLLATGCPATHANGVGQTALHIAALWGNSQALSALLAEIPLPRGACVVRKSRALHTAAFFPFVDLNADRLFVRRSETFRVTRHHHVP